MTKVLPQISVIMAVYNGEKYLPATLESIINQSFKNFELLIMDDGSTDSTAQILQSFSEKDHRIKLFHQKNKGNVAARNELIQKAATNIIAQMDADDIAYPERLAEQYSYIQSHPETVLVGTYAKIIEMTKPDQWRQSTAFEEDELNRWYLSIIPVFIHSSVMFKKNAFLKAGGYINDEYPAEDYGMFIRMKMIGKLNTVPKTLIEYKLHPKGVSAQNFKKQIAKRDLLNIKNLEDLYAHNEIPDVITTKKLLKRYDLNNHQRAILAKLACLTGCFYTSKNEYQKALPYFKLCLEMDGRRFDAWLNLFLAKINKAFLISIDKHPLRKKFLFKIHWFKT